MFFALTNLPRRLWRLLFHIKKGISGLERRDQPIELPIGRFTRWWLELSFYVFDILAIPEFYETIMDWLKWGTRPLTKQELEWARPIFGDSIDYNRVRVDQHAAIMCKSQQICYVSFYTVNSWGEMRPEILIHELVHIWQFTHYGSTYIPLALLAQRSLSGYDYGGIISLEETKLKNGGLEHYNLEQQAEIIADYFCLKTGRPARWAKCIQDHLPVYEYFVKQLKTENTK